MLSEYAGSVVGLVFYARHSLWHSIIGLGPLFAAHIVAASLGVIGSTVVAPSSRRVAAWIAAVSATIAVSWSFVSFIYFTSISGAVVGCAFALAFVYKKWPNKASEPTAINLPPSAEPPAPLAHL